MKFEIGFEVTFLNVKSSAVTSVILCRFCIMSITRGLWL